MPGNQDRKQKAEGDLSLAERETRVVELRLQGLEFDTIATQTGYINRSGAFKAWKRAMQRMPAIETHDARLTVEMRLNTMLATIWPMVCAGDYDALDRALAIEKERRTLMGLAKPPAADAGAGDQLAAILVEIAHAAAGPVDQFESDAAEDEGA